MNNIVKPQTPIINWNHSLSRGLIAVFAVTEKGGGLLNLVDRKTSLSLINSSAWTTGPIGPQLDCSTASDAGATNTSPPSAMKPAKQVSLLWQGKISASPSNNATFAELLYDVSGSSPFECYGFQIPGNSQTDIQWNWNNDGTFDFLQVTPKIAYNGIERQFIGILTSGSQIVYENGIQIGTKASTFTNINYGASPVFGIGTQGGTPGRSSNSKCSLCYVWNRVISAQEAWMLYINPLQIFKKPNFLNFYNSNPVITAPTGYASWASQTIYNPLIGNDIQLV